MKRRTLILFYFILQSVLLFSRPGSGGGGGSHGGGFGGGGFRGGGYYGHGGTMKFSDGELFVMFSVICCIILFCIIYIVWLHHRMSNNLTDNDRALKSNKSSDSLWNHKFLIQFSTNFYLELQAAWTKRDLTPIKEKMNPSLYNSYNFILNRYKKRGIVNKVTNVIIERANIIYFDDYIDNNKDAFAILIQGSMKDYFCKHGFKKNVPNTPFSDALVFNRRGGNWILREIINEPTTYQLAIPKTYIEK